MIPGAIHRSPGIYFSTEENPGKPQLGDSRRRLCDQSSPQLESLLSCRIAQHAMKRERTKEEKDEIMDARRRIGVGRG
jgi:hypothetical protein